MMELLNAYLCYSKYNIIINDTCRYDTMYVFIFMAYLPEGIWNGMEHDETVWNTFKTFQSFFMLWWKYSRGKLKLFQIMLYHMAEYFHRKKKTKRKIRNKERPWIASFALLPSSLEKLNASSDYFHSTRSLTAGF